MKTSQPKNEYKNLIKAHSGGLMYNLLLDVTCCLDSFKSKYQSRILRKQGLTNMVLNKICEGLNVKM